jgi:class 3 adenylate cyclase/predicted ATPase
MWSAAMDVGGWLRGLGLGEYEAKFRDNKIDADVLADLTDGDLEKLGLPLGDRKRLLKAIAGLVGLPSATAKSEPAQAQPLSSAAPQSASAERRPITVMFCDLVSSTALAAKLDAEDWRNLVNAYLDEAAAAVTGFGGHVLKRLGDGLMALFGYPQAQENDAERAVRAALAIQRVLGELNAKNDTPGAAELAARIGLESGSVVVEATGEVFGDAPNVAARVHAAAQPGSVLVTFNVQRQIAGLFVAEEQGAQELKGMNEPVRLFRITRASGARRRSGARAPTPFVGREEELGLLARRWERARAGEGQFVLIVGEPGLGKSRLIEEFHARLAGTPHTWVEWSASQLLQNTPLYPIAESGRQRVGGTDAPAEQRLAELESSLRDVGISADEVAPLLAPLLDIPLPPGRAVSLAPEEMRRRQLASIVSWTMAGARAQPVVLAFEDLQWADPTSVDVLGALAERGAQAPLFLVATSRPEFRPSWSMRSHHGIISLAPLDRVQARKMVCEIASRHALSNIVVEWVSERTGGVPLFVEEVTRLVLERRDQEGGEAIPLTLQQSLAARLDRLGAARETALIGSVLGRGFSHALLQAVADLDETELQSSIERLAEADILFVDGVAPRAYYRFKHVLIRDAAYDSLLKTRRQALHRRAAEVLQDGASPEPEAIAHHFAEAGLNEIAIEWWGKAGDQALRRSAFQEAIAHLGKAIAMADREADHAIASQAQSPAESIAWSAKNGELGTAEAFRKRRVDLHLSYGNALIATRGHGAVETTAAFARARQLASGLADPLEQLSIYYGIFAGSFVRGGETTTMREASLAALELAKRHPQSGEAALAHRMHGLCCWFEGNFTNALRHLEQSLALFDPERDRDFTFRFGQDLGVAAMNYLAFTLWPIGELERARELQAAATQRARETGHLHTIAYAVSYRAAFETMRSDARAAEPYAAETLELGRAHDLRLYIAYGAVVSGWVRARLGDREQGLTLMREGLDNLRLQGFALLTPLLYALLAEVQAELGDSAAALATLDQTLTEIDVSGHRTFDAEVHRVRGEILLKLQPSDPASGEAALQTAVAVAREQGARAFALRAAVSLARLYSTGRNSDARAILAPALEGFAPTPSTPEIAEAQALLTQGIS